MQRLFFSIVTIEIYDDRNIAQVGDTTSLYSARQKRFSSFNFAAVPPTTPLLPSLSSLARPTMGKKQATGQRRFLVIHHYYYVSVSGGAFNGLWRSPGKDSKVPPRLSIPRVSIKHRPPVPFSFFFFKTGRNRPPRIVNFVSREFFLEQQGKRERGRVEDPDDYYMRTHMGGLFYDFSSE